MWQALHEELSPHGLTVITVALDRHAADAEPWIAAAQPSHPSLVDSRHLVADLFNMVNVPTVVWIDEDGRIVRPNDVFFGSDQFIGISGVKSGPRLDALRRWVHEGVIPDVGGQSGRAVPTESDQLARAEFALGEWLFRQRRLAASDRHFARAGELAPHDFTIRRGSMNMRGKDPMGPEFGQMMRDWQAGGHSYYLPLPGLE